jgi:DNA-binding HxlR family transcriptional regulator
MSAPFEELSRLDRLIHEPARLAITTALSACGTADFTFLQRTTGLTRGNLGAHLSKLEDAAIVEVTKTFAGKTPRTMVALTPRGRTAIDAHWRRLRELGSAAEQWRAEAEDDTEPHTDEAGTGDSTDEPVNGDSTEESAS